MDVTALQVAQQFVGLKELPGPLSNPLVLGMLQMDNGWVQDDETSWCSAFASFICKCLPGCPRSKALAARSWLLVGRRVALADALPGWDVCILWRGKAPQPGPEVLAAPGHVAFYVGQDATHVLLLGGNQGDAVSIARFPKEQVLGVVRLL